MKSTSRVFVLAAMVLASACSTASAATDNLCDRPATSAMVEQDMGSYSNPMWILPDTGTYPGANGEKVATTWQKELRLDNPKTLTLHCYFNSQKTDTKTVPVNNANSITWSPNGTVTSN